MSAAACSGKETGIHSARSEAAAVVGLAVAAVVAIVALYDSPPALAVALVVLNGIGLWRWHSASDLAHFAAGAVFGNLTELACDAAGIWVHANRDIVGIAPVYIFLCYPLLGLAFPRLIQLAAAQDVAWERRKVASLTGAVGILALFVAFSCQFGRENAAQTGVCLVLLPVCLALFHERRDLAAAAIGGCLGLLWELPCTALRIWTFPQPQLFGLIPAWLPLAYALFFVALVRIGDALPINSWRANSPHALRTQRHES